MAPSFLRPVFLRMGVIEWRKRAVFQRHQHMGYEVIFVEHGTYRCEHNDLPVTLGPTDLLLVKPGDWHMDIFTGQYIRYFGMNFRLQTADGAPVAMFREGTPVRRQHFRIRRSDFLPILRQLVVEAETADFVSAHLQDTLTMEFFYRMVRAVPRDILSESFVETSRDASFAATLLSLLHARMNRKLHVGELARLMGMSESSLAHRCRVIMKCAPARLFARLKMERAMNLLKSTDMSVKEISTYLAFDNPFHFSRAFKRAFGQPPSEIKTGVN